MDLIKRQIALEERYTAQGAVDALNQWQQDLADGRLADTGRGRALTARTYGLLQEELEQTFAARARGLGGRYRALLREVGLDLCSVIALREFLGLFGRARQYQGRAREPIAQDFISAAGNAVEMEWQIKKLQLAAPGYTHIVLKSLDEAGTRALHHRRRTFLAAGDNVGIDTEDMLWSASEKEGCGRLLLEAVMQCGLCTLEQLPMKRGQHWLAIVPSDEMEAWLTRAGETIHAFHRYPPMLVPPEPHSASTLFSGASYLTSDMAARCGAIKLRSRRADHRRWVREHLDPQVLEAANKAAQQPYLIDVETATLLRDVFAAGHHNGVCGIPDLQPIVPPPYPMPEGWDREDPEMQQRHEEWKLVARQAYADDLVRKSHVRDFSCTMKYLREFTDDTLYFPTYFDWRGRLYFRSRINPQGSDVVKAVLRFKNKRPLGRRGLYWLKVHVATTYGFDKKHPDARAVWVDQHIDYIRACTVGHIDVEFFKAADSPWCFFVAARELIRALDSGNPEAWETGLAVAMDATCSGMQHLSAILRDPVGGLFTNLLPNNGEEKEDIYAASAGVTVSMLQKDAENPEQSKFWLSAGVPRGLAKRPVN